MIWSGILTLLLLFSGCSEKSTSASSTTVEAEIESEFGYTFKEGNLVTLDGGSSRGSIENYKFSYDGGTLCESSRSTCQTTDIPVGTHQIYLTVSNSDDSDTDFLTIQVEAKEVEKDSELITSEEVELKASIEVLGGSTFEEGEYVVFNGGESKGDIIRYEFSYSGGSLCESDNTTCRTNQIPAGEHKIHLTVYGVNGKSDSAFDFITVNSKNRVEEDSGVVTFDYSSNNGIYRVISKDSGSFTLSFTKASDEEIYIYNDPADIIGVATINDYSSLEKFENGGVQHLNSYDYSSRARTVREFGLAVFKNRFGYLVIYVLDIQDNTRSDLNDIVKFQYKVFSSDETTVENQKPVANFTASKTSITEGDSITFSSSSTDDKKITSFEWKSSINGSLSSFEKFSTKELSVGTHTVTLTVKDSEGLSDTASKTVTVNRKIVNNPPIAKISSFSKTSYYDNELITFSGRNSSDDKEVETFSWTSSKDGVIGYGEILKSRLSVGSHTITLKVEDSEGLSDTAKKSLVVKDSRILNGLVAHYEFEDNTNDSSGNGNHGTAHGGVSYVNGVIGKAGKFDGIDDHILVKNDISNSFSFTVWFKAEVSNLLTGNAYLGKHIISSENGGTNELDFGSDIYLTLLNDKLAFGGLTPSGDQSLFGVKEVIETWQFAVVIYSENKTRIYLNGEIEISSENLEFSVETEKLSIGYSLNAYSQSASNRFFNGLIDDLRIYNRALSEDEIGQLYKMGF